MLQSLTVRLNPLCRWLLAIALGVGSGNAAAAAATAAEAQRVVDRAEIALQNFQAAPNMGYFRQQVQKAKGVLVLPDRVKGGLILGGAGGNGVLLERTGESWSHPVFYSLASLTFGLQIGAEVAEVVLMIMTDRGMQAMYTTEFKLGADVSVAAGPTGAGAQAATVDVLAYSRSKGGFAGVTIEGAVLSPHDALNSAYYGTNVRPVEIIRQGAVSNPGADRLRNTMAGTAGGQGVVGTVPALEGDPSVLGTSPAPDTGESESMTPIAAGSGGYDLLTIQQSLRAKGYDPGSDDGKLGPATRRAIRTYESDQGLPVTGTPSLELQRLLASH